VLWQITRRELLDKPTHNPIGCVTYFGRWPDPTLAGTVDLGRVHPEEPHEPTADGCPGGWYRTAFANSVAPYLRRRVDNGARVPNYRFDDPSTPWQVKEAAVYYEQEQERWYCWRDKVTHKRYERAHPKPKKKGG